MSENDELFETLERLGETINLASLEESNYKIKSDEENEIGKDYKNLKEIIELSKEEIENNDKNITTILDIKDLQNLKNILANYKKMFRANKTFKNFISDFFSDNLEEDYILVEKIKDKIKEYENEIEQLKIENVTYDSGVFKLRLKIEVLQELLESEKWYR